MRKVMFRFLAQLNKVALPRMSKHDLTKLTKVQKAIVAYRYWVTIHAVE